MLWKIAPPAQAVVFVVFIVVGIFYVWTPTLCTLRGLSLGPVPSYVPDAALRDASPAYSLNVPILEPVEPSIDASSTTNCLIVKVKLEDEDTSWLSSLPSAWQNHHLSTIDSMYVRVRKDSHRPDKGRIAEKYLAWIIKNYNDLPEIMVFLPPHDRKQDTSGATEHQFAKDISLLQTPLIQDTGFAYLSCSKTCNFQFLDPHNPPYEIRAQDYEILSAWHLFSGQTGQMPNRIAVTLGSTFVLSQDQVRKYPVSKYVKLLNWLNETEMDDDSSGLLFEWLWHVVFGKDADFCAVRDDYTCKIYGMEC